MKDITLIDSDKFNYLKQKLSFWPNDPQKLEITVVWFWWYFVYYVGCKILENYQIFFIRS